METQLIQDVILKFETNQFRSQQNIQNHAKSALVQVSDRTSNESAADSFQKTEIGMRKDKAARSLLGQYYLWALVNWLADYPRLNITEHFNNETYRNVSGWLGNKSPEKEKLVRIIVAKLTYDWKSLKKFNQGSVNKGLAYFANSVDIWQYAFPKMLDKLLQDIGRIEFKMYDPYEKPDIGKHEITNIENEFSIICKWIRLGNVSMCGSANINDLIKIWLIASITKTLKDQTGLTGLFDNF